MKFRSDIYKTINFDVIKILLVKIYVKYEKHKTYQHPYVVKISCVYKSN
jgi:hypothetical protein